MRDRLLQMPKGMCSGSRGLFKLKTVIRPHRQHVVRRCGSLLQMSHVAWSVSLSVCVCVSVCVLTHV